MTAGGINRQIYEPLKLRLDAVQVDLVHI